MTIAPFGWQDNSLPAVDAENLEAMHAASGAYADSLQAPVFTQLGNLGASATISLSATQNLWFVGELTQNVVITVEYGFTAGAQARVVVTQATSGQYAVTFSLTNAEGTATYAYGSAFTQALITLTAPSADSGFIQ